MPVIDASNLRRFAENFVGKSVALDGQHGRVAVTREELLEIANAAEAAIDAGEYEQLLAAQERWGAVEGWIESQRAAGQPVPPGLVRALGGTTHDARLVEMVSVALQTLGLDGANETHASALLTAIQSMAESLDAEDTEGSQQLLGDDEMDEDPDEGYDGYDEEAEQEPAPRVVARKVAAAPRRRAAAPGQHRQRRTARTEPMLPGGRPVPAPNPREVNVTADQLFGVRRSGSGRYELGGLDADEIGGL